MYRVKERLQKSVETGILSKWAALTIPALQAINLQSLCQRCGKISNITKFSLSSKCELLASLITQGSGIAACNAYLLNAQQNKPVCFKCKGANEGFCITGQCLPSGVQFGGEGRFLRESSQGYGQVVQRWRPFLANGHRLHIFKRFHLVGTPPKLYHPSLVASLQPHSCFQFF